MAAPRSLRWIDRPVTAEQRQQRRYLPFQLADLQAHRCQHRVEVCAHIHAFHSRQHLSRHVETFRRLFRRAPAAIGDVAIDFFVDQFLGRMVPDRRCRLPRPLKHGSTSRHARSKIGRKCRFARADIFAKLRLALLESFAQRGTIAPEQA